MIVSCDQCSTRFRLDDSHVPAEGIRVRCSRCKHAFFLQPPGSHESDALHQAASEAAAAATPPPPGTTQDLPSEAEIDAASGDLPDFDEVEESDWQFNEELPEPDDTLVELPQAPAEAEAEPDDVCESSGVFGIAEDLSSLSWASPEGVGEGQASEDESEAPAETEQPGSAGFEGASAADELGDPQSWDLLGEQPLEHASSPQPETRTTSRVEQAADESSAHSATGPDLDSPRPEVIRKAGIPSWLGRVGRAAGWVAVMGLFGLGVFRGVGNPLEPVSDTTRTFELGSFSASDVRAYWLDTARAGTLYVVEGRLLNPQSADLLPGSGLRVRLETPFRTESGALVAPFIEPLQESLMRELPPNDLWDSLGRAAQEFASAEIPPGESVPFAAVFAALPDAATGFKLEASVPQLAPGP